jgi:hypothetical protein
MYYFNKLTILMFVLSFMLSACGGRGGGGDAATTDNLTAVKVELASINPTAGLSLVDNQEDLPYVKALGLTGSVSFGDNNVNGWTIGLKANF